ncbi:MAG: hypothetical protein K2W78_10225 [Xanthobacteraceae bacterium]|nr:hypothetical protein [Xanthobacteraceae bacterium]
MTRGEKIVPHNVLRFEILLYVSLLMDALSYPFRDIPDDMSSHETMVMNLLGVALIVLFFYLIWTAARQRRNWARWALVISLVLSILTLADVLSSQGWSFPSVIDVCSSALTAWGLYASFTGDARGWFNA